MSKRTKIWLMIAASLVLIGCGMFAGVIASLQWDFSKLSTVEYETNRYEIHEEFQNILIATETADIELIPAADSKATVVCLERTNEKHAVAVKDGTLVIEAVDARSWYEYIGVNFGSPKVTVYIPQGAYGDLSIKSSTGDVNIPKDFTFQSMDISESTGDVTNCASAAGSIKIKTSTGDIRVENTAAGMLDLSVSTGRVIASNVACQGDAKISVTTGKAFLTDMTCKNFLSGGDTGDISLRNVIATETFSIDRSTGGVKLDGCDGAAISLETDTGDITGSFLTGKVFIAQSDTGSVDVPKTVTGGKCEISSNTGDIRISILQAS